VEFHLVGPPRHVPSITKAWTLFKKREYSLLTRKTLARVKRGCQVMLEIVDSWIWARFRTTKGLIRQVWSGEQTIAKDERCRVVLYAHHDPHGIVDDYVMYQLCRIAELPAKIVFVSTSPELPDDAIRRIQPYCHTIILRKNIGLDFGSWKAAMDVCPSVLDSAKTLILTNDSCYGPFHSLRDVVSELESQGHCLAGITTNQDPAYHIQSYFMLLPESVLSSEFFSQFKASLGYVKPKWEVIRRFEVGTSLLAQRHGIDLYPWVKNEALSQSGLAPEVIQSNVTVYGWDFLLCLNLSPFLKKSLFTESRMYMADREPVLWEHLREQTPYPPTLIESHLFRMGIPVKRVWDWDLYQQTLAGKRGMEIGGPSDVFRSGSFLPVYDLVGELTAANFAQVTVWQQNLGDNGSFVWHPRRSPGRLFIAEATNLSTIPDQEYEFVLASHVLEHIANPLQAIEEWLRILVPGGMVLLIVPHKDFTFDHRRPTTSIEHLLADYAEGVQEDDLTHLEEILELHDLERDPAGNRESFRRRCLDNQSNRCLHHHVFDLELAQECLTHFGLRVLSARLVAPFHQVVLAQKQEGMSGETVPGVRWMQ
jgi:SAM-dependent methyltransferase